MSQTPSASTYRSRFDAITKRGVYLTAKPEPTTRDCWEVLDLLQQYVDTLGEMADNLPPYEHDLRIFGEQL